MSESAKQQINKIPVTGWTKSTVADGYFLNTKTIQPLVDRDVKLADLIDDIYAKLNTLDYQKPITAEAPLDLTDDKLTLKLNSDCVIEYDSDKGGLDVNVGTGLKNNNGQLEVDTDSLLNNVVTDVYDFIRQNKTVQDNYLVPSQQSAIKVYKYEDKFLTTSLLKNNTDDTTFDVISLASYKYVKDGYQPGGGIKYDSYNKQSEYQTYSKTALDTKLSGKQNTLTFSGPLSKTGDTVSLKVDNSTIKVNSNNELYAEGAGSANKFGNAVLSLNQDKVYTVAYINNNTVHPLSTSDLTTVGATAKTDSQGNVYEECKSVYGQTCTKSLDACAKLGVNNFVIRLDDITVAKDDDNNSIIPVGNLSIDVDNLDMYKMYTINLVPTGYDVLAKKQYDSSTYAMYQINLVFRGKENKRINFTTAQYSCVTYGYHYNVPQFGHQMDSTVTCYTDNNKSFDINANGYFSGPSGSLYVDNFISRQNSIIHDQAYQIYLNDNGKPGATSTNNPYLEVKNHNVMYTVQPHSSISVTTSLAGTAGTDYVYTINGEKVNEIASSANSISGIFGNTGIKGKIAELAVVNVDSGTTSKIIWNPLIYQRQISFMRGPDISVKTDGTEAFMYANYSRDGSGEYKPTDYQGTWYFHTSLSYWFYKYVTDNKSDFDTVISNNFATNLGTITDTTQSSGYGWFNSFLKWLSTNKETKDQFWAYSDWYCKNYTIIFNNVITERTNPQDLKIKFATEPDGTGWSTGYTIYYFTQASY